ncbi:Mob1/phocein [Microthyrium microscopicum]|uniref:Mob1/phocein n=1 Tax=Microthyrium microscopicum TaxID=703497 RepID=A0A6A6UNB8_9PEZI|nr:Mob1/phocein [Microthyrium microscopicum]
MTSATMSPGSSPRLPSPPPMAEDQLGPKSPISHQPTEDNSLGPILQLPDTGSSRRIRPGTKSSDMPEGPPVIDISEIDTAYQLTEHLKALYNTAIHPKDTATIVPIDRQTAIRLATPPKDIDRAIWLYELCRFLCQKVNGIIIALFADEPPCSAQTCSEMRASEWQYLCAVHDPPKPCCAIDYCCHTLDWAANVLTSQKHFPSRMSLGPEQGASHQQMRQLTNIFRRVYRIFAHAWFQHREMFWKVEGKTGLYVFFKTVCDVYSLIPEDNYTVPPEAEGREPAEDEKKPEAPEVPSILSRPKQDDAKREPTSSESTSDQPMTVLPSSMNLGPSHTTKRHRQTPSVDAGVISTVLEESEEDDSRSVAGSDITTLDLGSGSESLADSLDSFIQVHAPKIETREIEADELSPELPETEALPMALETKEAPEEGHVRPEEELSEHNVEEKEEAAPAKHTEPIVESKSELESEEPKHHTPTKKTESKQQTPKKSVEGEKQADDKPAETIAAKPSPVKSIPKEIGEAANPKTTKESEPSTAREPQSKTDGGTLEPEAEVKKDASSNDTQPVEADHEEENEKPQQDSKDAHETAEKSSV